MSSALATPLNPKPLARAGRYQLSESTVLAGALGLLLFGPLAFGAVEPWAIFALETGTLLVTALWVGVQLKQAALRISSNVHYAPMAAFFGLLLVQLVVGATAYRHASYMQVMLYAAFGMLVFVVTQTLRRSSQFEVLAIIFTGYGAAVALFALLQGLSSNGKIYWLRSLERGGLFYGPYVNHNHYAGLMEMLMPFPLVMAASHFSEGTKRLTLASIAALMAGTIFLSGSRGGMVAFAAEMVVFGVLLIRKRNGNWKQALILGAFLLMLAGFLVWIGSSELTRRVMSIHSEAREEMSGGVRFTIDRDCWRMLIKKPILGWGSGTFPVVYPQFRSFYTTFFVNEAHNDYLQLLVETGLAGFGIAIWFFVVMFRQAVRKLENWMETGTGAMTVAALLGCIGILVHSFLDFNLQIPANAALFYVLCGMAASGPLLASKRRRAQRRHRLIVEPIPGAVS